MSSLNSFQTQTHSSKSPQYTWSQGFHYYLLSLGSFFLSYLLQCISNGSYLQLQLIPNQLSQYRKDHIWYFLLSSSRLLLVAFIVVSGAGRLHGQLSWSHEWSVYPVWQMWCNSTSSAENMLLVGKYWVVQGTFSASPLSGSALATYLRAIPGWSPAQLQDLSGFFETIAFLDIFQFCMVVDSCQPPFSFSYTFSFRNRHSIIEQDIPGLVWV